MDVRSNSHGPAFNALLIAPRRELASQFCDTIAATHAFQIVGDLKNYPTVQTLDIRLRQMQPEVVLLDLASDLDVACEIIRFVSSFRPPVQVIGLHAQNDSEAILRALRSGASEFLYAPFEPEIQREAIARIERLRRPETSSSPELGRVIAFSSAKPGSGASTMAAQTAFALKKLCNRRVLLTDFDLLGGTIGFYLKLNHGYSLADALKHAERMDPALWSTLTVNHHGVDILPAPDVPATVAIDAGRLHGVLEYARLLYDWVVIDLPAVFHRTSLMALSESDQAFLISTSELPSLHLARKAVNLLSQLGFASERFHVVVNRVNKRDGLGGSDIEKIFNCKVHTSIPNDYFSLHRVVTLGQPLASDCELGKAIENFAGKIAGVTGGERRRPGGLLDAAPALSQT
ncbi:MAG: hypothetical protein IT160_13265 [Bryobacterales bacterium]|nr:hypothetical protein [Bryobacterales bacterium]